MTTTPILLTGGTGKTGRRVADRLNAHDVSVRIGSRNGSPPFNWERPDTWNAALEGMEAVYLTYYPDLAAPGSAEAVTTFLAKATTAGVEHVVLLSGRGEPEAEECERLVRESGLDWTIVRAAVFAQDFSEDFLLDAVRSGVVAFPAGDVKEPFVDANDIADIVTAALTDDRHRGQLYEVTSPRLLSFAEAVGEIAAATGKNLEYVPVPPADYQAALVGEVGMPTEQAAMLRELFETIFDGRNERVTDGVQQALGRPARDFGDFARAAADAGVWD